MKYKDRENIFVFLCAMSLGLLSNAIFNNIFLTFIIGGIGSLLGKLVWIIINNNRHKK